MGPLNFPRLFLLLCLLCFTLPVHAERLSVIDKLEGKSLGGMDYVQVGRYDYVTVSHFAAQFGLPVHKDLVRKKITISMSDGPVTLTALSPFVMAGGTMMQMPVNTLFKNGEFYIPLSFFIRTIRNVFPGELEYKPRDHALLFTNTSDYFSQVNIEDMENGVLIRIKTVRPFDRSNIYTSESNGWFYVDFYGGKIDTFRTFPVDSNQKTIRKIIPIQLSDDTARLSFHVRPKIQENNVYVKNGNEINITLRTTRELSQNVLDNLEKEREKWKIDIIVIDPGHGGRDPGAIGRDNVFEKNITLAIARLVKEDLEKKVNAKVIMTRDGDQFPRLKDRTELANKKNGKLFLSIHVDSNPSSRIHGHTVYFLGMAKTDEARRVAQFENSVIKLEDDPNDYVDLADASFILAANAQNSYSKESEDFAVILDQQIRNGCESYSHGVKQAGFQVLYNASMPSVLIETAYISNRYDSEKLVTRSYQKAMAQAISNGIIQFQKKYEESLN